MRTVCAAALALVAPVVWAQNEEKPAKPAEPPATVDAAAQAVLDKSAAAIKGLKDLSCTIEQSAPMGEGARGTMTLTVAQGDPIPLGMYKASITDDQGKPTVEYSFDGKVLRKLDHASKTLLSLEVKDEKYMPPMDLWGLIPQWAFGEQIPPEMFVVVAAALGGEETVDGVKCVVVQQTRELTPPDEGGQPGKAVFTEKRWLGADDHLPRKVETTIKMSGMPMPAGMDEMKTTGRYSNLKANTSPTAEAFALTAPEGYASKAGTAEDLGVEAAGGGGQELSVKAGDPAPTFNLKDAAGKEYTLEGLKGRVVLLDFWATWCGPCKQAMPAIQRLHEKFKDKPVSVMGVNVMENSEDAGPKYMAKKNFTYPCLLKGDDLAKAYGISAIPTLIVIGPDGKVVHAGVGFNGGEEDHLAKLIEEQLAKIPK